MSHLKVDFKDLFVKKKEICDLKKNAKIPILKLCCSDSHSENKKDAVP